MVVENSSYVRVSQISFEGTIKIEFEVMYWRRLPDIKSGSCGIA